MKPKLLLFNLLLAFVLGSWPGLGAVQAQTQLAQESFETDGEGTRYTSNTFDRRNESPTPYPAQYFLRAQHPVTGFNTANNGFTASGINGTWLWASEGARGQTGGAPDRDPRYVQLSNISISGKSNIQVKVLFADPRGLGSGATIGQGTNNWENDDYVRIKARINGGSWVTIGQLVGDNAAGATGGRLRQDSNLNGISYDDLSAPAVSNVFQDFTYTVSGTGTTLDVMVEVDQIGGSEELAFDNIQVLATAATTAAPVLATIEGTSINYNEGDPATQITNTLTVSDADSPTLTGGSVSITTGFVSAQDRLLFTPQNGITGSYNTNTGILTLSGTATLAAYQAALRSVRYQNVEAVTAIGGLRLASFSVTDGTTSSNTATRNIIVNAQLNAPATLPYTEDFETNGEGLRYATDTWSSSSPCLGFLRTNNNPYACSPVTFGNISNSYYWYAEGTSNGVNPNPVDIGTMTLAPVNASNYNNLRFNIRLATGQSAQWESDDYVKFYYRVNGGSWVLFSAFYGNGTLSSPGELQRDTNLDGVADAGTGSVTLNSTLQNVDLALPSAVTGASIDFQILINNDGQEELAFDRINITGTQTTTINSISRASTPLTNAATVNYTVTFGAPVTGLTASNFTLTTSGISGATVGTPTAGSGNTWTVPVNTGSGSGTLRLDLANSSNVSPTVSNVPYTGGETYTIDKTQPTVVISSTASATGGTTSISPIPFTVTFSEAVTGFVAGDVTVTNGTITSGIVNGSGTTYTFTVTPTTSGTVTVNVPANVAQDAAGNGNTAASQYSITYQPQTAAPVVTRLLPSNGNAPINSESPRYEGTAAANSTVKIYVDGVLNNTVTAWVDGSWGASTIGNLSNGTHSVYATAQLSGALVSVNSNTLTFTVDTVKPTVSITSTAGASGSTTTLSPIPFTVTFSENVTGFDAGDITVTNGTITGGIVNGSGLSYTFTVIPTANGVVTVNVPTSVARDAAGNYNTAATQFSITYNEPAIAAPVVNTPANGTLVATTTPAYTGTAVANSTVTVFVDGTTIGTTTATTGSNWIITQPSTLAQGSHTVRATATTVAGNTSSSSNTNSFTVDSIRPTVSIRSSAGSSGSSTSITPIPFTVTFSESVTGFVADDLTVTNGTLISNSFSGSGTTYTFTVTPAASGATTTINVPANVAQDATGNGNTAASQFNITYQQPLVATAQSVTVNLSANGTAILTASNVNNGSTGSGTLTYTIQKIVYGRVDENQTLTLSTPNGANFTSIRFASFGTPSNDTNGNYRLGACDAANSLVTAVNSFLNRSTGSMDATTGSSANNNPILGDPCPNTPKSLAVQAAYSADAASLTYDCAEAGKTQYVLLTVSNGSTTSTAMATVTVNPSPTGTITSVSPSSGQRGATVTVAGTNLSGIGSTITVNSATATVSGLTPTGFTFVVPAGATIGAGNFSITAPCSQVLTSAFTVQAPPLQATVSTTSASPTSNSPIPFSVSFSQSVGSTFTASDVTVAGGTVASGSFSGSGAGPYTFTVIPAGAGTVTVSLAVNVAHDANSTGNSASNSVSVQFQAPTITIAPASLTNGTQGTAYSQTFIATGGSGTYTYDITSVALPSGLSLSGSTLSGTPTANGTFNFRVTATDNSAAPGPYSGFRDYTLTIAAPAVTAVTWTGSANTDWFTAGNWTPNQVPDATINVTIPTSPSGGRFPAITSGTASTRNLTINSGATLTQLSGTLSVNANLTNNGTFLPTGGTVALGSTVQSSILGSGNTRFWNLTVGTNGTQSNTPASTSVQRLLSLNGNFATNGNPFTLESNASGTAMVVNNGSSVVSGNVTVQRYINPLNPGLGYRHYSSPVQNTTIADLATSSFTPVVNDSYNPATAPRQVQPYPTVYYYDQSRLTTPNASYAVGDFDNGFLSPNALASPLVPGRGYSVNVSGTTLVDLVGQLNNGTISTGTLARGAQTSAGWQFLGNPYPSPIDWNQLYATSVGIENGFYVFKSNGQYTGAYATYLTNGQSVNGGISTIPSMQGFFVRAQAGGGRVSFTNQCRLTNYDNSSAFARQAADTRPTVRLELMTAQGQKDEALVYFEPGATSGIDARYDAVKLANATRLNLCSRVGSDFLAINGLPNLSAFPLTVPLSVQVPSTGRYTLLASQLANVAGNRVVLHDRQTGTLTDLTDPAGYVVELTEGQHGDRFDLLFNPATEPPLDKKGQSIPAKRH